MHGTGIKIKFSKCSSKHYYKHRTFTFRTQVQPYADIEVQNNQVTVYLRVYQPNNTKAR